MEVALGQLVYEKSSFDTHLHFEDCPCKELSAHERGVDTVRNIPTERWPLGCNGPVTSPTRLMGEEAMYRDHRVRILKEIGNEPGMGENRIWRKSKNGLDVIGRDWEVERESRVQR